MVLLCRALESVCRIFIRIKSYPREKDINEGQESGGEVPRTIFYGPLNNYHLYTVLALLTYTRSVFGQRSRNK